MTKRILWLLALLPSLAFGGLEDLTGGSKYIDDLVATNPLSNDAKSEGDDHIRGVKNVLKNTFPNVTGPVTATQTELNYTDVTTPGTVQASKAIVTDSSGDITNVDINGGTIDGTTIGGSSAAAGSFTTITASSTITSSAGSVSVQSTNGGDLYLQDTDASTNEKIWSIHGEAGTVYLRTRTDANGAGETALQCTRSDTAVGTCTFDNGAVQIDETLNVSQSITANSNFFNVNTVPYYGLVETDAAANNQRWAIMSNATQLAFRAFDDSWSANEAAIVINRSGTNITSTQFDNGNVLIDENLTVTGTVDLNGGAIDGTTVGASSASTGAFTTLTASGATTLNGDTDLGNATGDTITATGRFDSDLVPSTDSARDLGTSSLQWAEAHIDSGFIDDIETSGDISHTKACATNYTRAAPGLCVLTTGTTSVTNLTTDACTSITFPTGSNYVQVKVQVNTGSAGSAGSRLAVITMYSDTGCSTQSGLSVGAPAEEVAGITANKAMANNDGDFIIPNNSSYRIKLVDDTANKGGGWFNIPMYWDN